jgi:hypothetical protein
MAIDFTVKGVIHSTAVKFIHAFLPEAKKPYYLKAVHQTELDIHGIASGKEGKMKKTFFGIMTAFAVTTALLLAGCPTEGTDSGGKGGLKTLSGNVTISPSSGVTTGTKLTALYRGSEKVSYQWNKDGKAVANATLQTHTPGEAGTYTVTVSATGYKSKTSAGVTVTGASLPDLPGNVTISPSSGVTTGTKLTATYSRDERVSYQWNKDGAAITGAAGNEYTPGEAGTYTVTVSATGYKSKTSDPITVTGASLPELPGNITISPSGNVTTGTPLTANYSGTETVSYQWSKGGSAISGATGSLYTPGEEGAYTVTVSMTGYKSKTSAPVTVTGASLSDLEGNITITSPEGFTTGKELTAVYSGGETVTYLWKLGGTVIPGASGNKLIAEDPGAYTVTVSAEGYKTKTSAGVTVTGNPLTPLPGVLSVNPQSGVTTGTELTVTYSGSETVTYQWNRNGIAITGASGNKLTPFEPGTYTVTARAPEFKSVTSAGVGVTGASPARLTENVFTDGNLPLNGEQWYKFTATASEQYIHANFYTLTSLYVYVYDANGIAVGSQTRLNSSNTYATRTVTAGQEYYIRVTPYSSSGTGSYMIGFNTSTTPAVLPSAGVTVLTENVFADGNIPTSSDMQWFKFTATASAQYIHFSTGTLNHVYVQVYDANGIAVGNNAQLTSSTTYASRTVTAGQEFYIRVWPASSSYSGTYRIGFNTGTTAPNIITLPATGVTQLTENVWADGNLSQYGEQWYKFTATASEQYIHASFVTLDSSYGMYVQVYDASGAKVESETRLASTPSSTSRTITAGQVYYISVWPYSSSRTGTYRIGFNTGTTAPNKITLPTTGVTQLTENVWADGEITATVKEQWYKFTATASTQYIHASFGTLTLLYVQAYDASGAKVGDETFISGSTTRTSPTVTAGQEYYIRVWYTGSSYSGTYKIAFNKETGAPSITLPSTGVIQLNENVWTDGNLPTSSDMQWFKFTATASAQYIHVSFGTLSWFIVQVYDANGIAVGSMAGFATDNTPYASRTVTSGQEYYIKVTSGSSSYSGTYKIAFNKETAAPAIPLPTTGVTQLAENVFKDDNLPTSSDVQWYKFTATAVKQYIHASFGTLAGLFVQVYNASGTAVGNPIGLAGSAPSAFRTLTVGNEYYIRVLPGSSSSSGTYKIAFNTAFIPPGVTPTQLTENVFEDGDLPLNGVQWFKFTATASTQYIHNSPGTLSYILLLLYDASGATVGYEDGSSYGTRTVTPGEEYYIRARPGISTYSGTYKIGFNTGTTVPNIKIPATGVTQLTLNVFADGNLTTGASEQWFKFTATAGTQYIHYRTGTLSYILLQVYNAGGAEVGSQTILYSSGSASRTVTSGQEYYIRARPYGGQTGTYKIGFNTGTTAPPDIILPATGAIQLTVNVFADGNITALGDAQWFKFTATIVPQYIHFSPGTLTALYVQAYNASGATVGSMETLASPPYTTYTALMTVTAGQEYYIRVLPYNSSQTGTYRIGFNTGATEPNINLPATGVTQLTENVFEDGNLPTDSDVRWYKFTATTATQYIHLSPDTINAVHVQVYDASGVTVGSRTTLYGSKTYASWTVTAGQVYYIRVSPSNSLFTGTYKIGFNTSETAPAQ